jgi:hypothetical protein
MINENIFDNDIGSQEAVRLVQLHIPEYDSGLR